MKVLISESAIKKRVAELASEINEAYTKAGCQKLYVIAVLRGGFIFAADLVRGLKIPVELDFVWASSYGSETKSSGNVKLVRDLELNIAGQDVLIIEDIVDTGHTMDFMLKHLQSKGPKSLSVCSLLHKPAREVKKIPIRFLGFKIEDHFVVGYGLDFNNLHREIPEIVILKGD